MSSELRGGGRLAAGFLLLLTAQCQADRDPFRPVETRCQPQQAFAMSWRLKGIIGRENDYRALMVTEKGKWAQRRKGEPVDEQGYLLDIARLGVTLADRKGCQPPVKQALKGDLYEKDNLSAGDPLPARFTG